MDVIQDAMDHNKHISEYKFDNGQTWDQFCQKAAGRDIYLYGLGKAARYFVEKYGNKIKLSGVIDNYIDLQGFCVGDYLPEAVETLCERAVIFDAGILEALDPEKTLILISNINGYEEIARQISSYHIDCFVLLLMEAGHRRSSRVWDADTGKKPDLKDQKKEYVKHCCGLPIAETKAVFMIGKYGGHAKYITEALIRKNSGLDIVWLVDDLRTGLPEGVRPVWTGNWKKYIYEMETARIWVFDIILPEFVRKRKGQIYIQAKHWASITLKKFFLDDLSTTSTESEIKRVKYNGKIMDYIFVGSDFDRDTCQSGFAYRGAFIFVGSPRSDALFCTKNRGKVYSKYRIAAKTHTVLYAPTFRYDKGKRKKSAVQGLDFIRMRDKLELNFGGKWKILFRGHPSLSAIGDGCCAVGDVIDVSGHDDSQELVAACDMLVSDYSSIMFEAAFAGKTVLLFAPDKKQYIGKERDLYIDYSSLPFPIAETNEELWDIMERFDDDGYKRNVDCFMRQYGVHEDGHASERAAEFLMGLVRRKHKVSVIIPIYNTAAYLPRCIESVMQQTYQNIEIILVDDGSTDNSLQICESYAKKDPRIILISQENGGNNAARKAGLRVSTGEYVTFVDSDDWIGSDLVSLLCKQTEEHSVDLVVSNVQMTCVDGKEKERTNLLAAGVYTDPKDAVKKLFFDYEEEDCKYGILPYIFAKLYRKDLAMRSMEKIEDRVQYDEDRALVWTCLMQDITAAFIDAREYYYCQRADGLVRTRDEMYLAKVNYFYCYMSRLFENEDLVLRKQLERYVAWNVQIAFKWKMGMSENALPNFREKYILDHSALMGKTRRVVLYGAGMVGRDYYAQLQESQKIFIVAWVDREWKERRREGLAVKPIEEALHLPYDNILIAVKQMEIFKEIKAELTSKGVSEEKILWGKPYESVFLFYGGRRL